MRCLFNFTFYHVGVLATWILRVNFYTLRRRRWKHLHERLKRCGDHSAYEITSVRKDGFAKRGSDRPQIASLHDAFLHVHISLCTSAIIMRLDFNSLPTSHRQLWRSNSTIGLWRMLGPFGYAWVVTRGYRGRYRVTICLKILRYCCHTLWHVGASCLVSFEVPMIVPFSKHKRNRRFTGCRPIHFSSNRNEINLTSGKREMIGLNDFLLNLVRLFLNIDFQSQFSNLARHIELSNSNSVPILTIFNVCIEHHRIKFVNYII